MLWIIAVALLVLCALGLVSSCSAGQFINLQLSVAVVLVLLRVLQGRIAAKPMQQK